jgi:phospholipid-transporting ATPase
MSESRTRGSNRDSNDAGHEAEQDVTDGIMMSKFVKPRIIQLGQQRNNLQTGSSPTRVKNENYIITAKYTWLSFIPKFLFEQFRRYANIFFLAIGLCQQIPDVSPTGRYVTIVPFTVILALTALKELIEDAKRHRADKKTNGAITWTYNKTRKEFEKMAWKDICVGDILRVENDKYFPADLVLLSSSEPQGICYIETSNLDGETNLKIRSAVQSTVHLSDEENLATLQGIYVLAFKKSLISLFCN